MASATLVAPVRPARDPDDVTDGSDSPRTKGRIEYILPPLELLNEPKPQEGESEQDLLARKRSDAHERGG